MAKTFIEALCERSQHVNRDDLDKSFHFTCFKQNIYNGNMAKDHFAMFNAGSGNELKKKATAVHSSSMLAYNFFHWISPRTPFTYDGTDYNKVVFEVKIPTINKSRAPANMDVVLVSEDKTKWLMLESKFTEYCSRSNREMLNLSHGYFDLCRYYFRQQTDEVNKLVELVRDWYERARNATNETQYYDGIKQQLCHLIAIKNLTIPVTGTVVADYCRFHNKFLEEEVGKLKTIEFKTLLFDPLEEFRNERKAYDDYSELCNCLWSSYCVLFPNGAPRTGVVTYSQIWNAMSKQIKDAGLGDFLEDRYIQFSSFNSESWRP